MTDLATHVLLVAFFAACAGVRAEEPRYTFYDLGTLEYGSWALANDIDDRGMVVGGTPVNGEERAYVWYNGVMTNIGEPLDLDWWMAEGRAISETGVVTGHGPPHVPIWPHAPIDQMDIPEGCMENRNPDDINNSGMMIAGSCEPDDGSSYNQPAVYWVEDGSAVNLGFLPDSPPDAQGYAQGVNDAGVVVGTISSVGNATRSFIWVDAVMSEIPNLLGGTGVTVKAINNNGLIVGLAGTPDDYPAMSYDMKIDVMRVLGPGAALGVNDRGDAVGSDIIDLSAVHAILYRNGEAIDLHEFMSGQLLTSDAFGINNYGWIVGKGDDLGGTRHAWLLVPVYDKGDYDGDTDVDHQDFQHFQRCLAAEPYIDGTLHVGCDVFDFDHDQEVTLKDYTSFQGAFTGPVGENMNPDGPG